MNYKFPVIKCLDDILPAIEGRDEFVVVEKDGDYTVVNYTVMFDDTFPPVSTINDAIRRECRGLIFRTSTREILHRRLAKFFNANEKEETQIANIRWDKPHVILEKLDGSMITPVSTSEGRRWGTKMGVTDVALPVEEFLVNRKEYDLLCNFMEHRGFTPIFEWCSRKQRIVIDYPEDQLVLIAARNNITGEYMPYRDLGFAARMFMVPLVKQYEGNAQNMQDLVNETKDLEEAEGFVVRFETGHMIKVKAESYILLHKAKDTLSYEKNIVELLVNDKADDFKSLLQEQDFSRFIEFESKFWDGISETVKMFDELVVTVKNNPNNAGWSKKDYAVNFVQQQPEEFRRFLYALWDGKPAFSLIVDAIRSSCSTQAKIDSVRWLWKGHNWLNQSKSE